MSDSPSSHPALEQLGAYALGRLGEGESETISKHVLECDQCCHALDSLSGQADPFVHKLQKIAQTSSVANGARVDVEETGRQKPHAPSALPKIPGYEVLELIGRGGMGVVYRARHVGLNRLVALKMVLSGSHAGPEELVRFRKESETVAQLRHHHIVQVYDTGTADGLPFFAMELVEGTNLKELVDGTPQNPHASAHLSRLLAQAMQAAHAQGIIHRDLKPANILMVSGGMVRGELSQSDADPTHHSPLTTHHPKISDFGLAKRLNQDGSITQTGAVAGTPGFMAPEQALAKSESIGVQTDVYALGAILYNLITGRPPFLADTSIKIIQQVLEQDPISPRSLNPSVDRDLETICLKCLEKEPVRRYASAQSLADDLGRYLRGEPIHARKVGASGKLWRWAKRNRQLAAVSALLLLVLLAAAVTGPLVAIAYRQMAIAEREMTGQALTAQQEAEAAQEREKNEAARSRVLQQQAEREAALSQEVSTFLLGLFDDADPLAWSGRAFGVLPEVNPSALEMVERGAAYLSNRDELKDRPLVRAALLDKIGSVFLSLGRTDKAQPLLTEALELRRRSLPALHEDLAASLYSMGFLHFASGDPDQAASYLQQALTMRQELLGKDHPQVLESTVQLGVVRIAQGQPGEAEVLLQEALQAYRLHRRNVQQSPEAARRNAQWMFMSLAALIYRHAQQNDAALKAAPLLTELQQVAQDLPNKEFGQVVVHYLDAEKHNYAGKAIAKLSQAAADGFLKQAEANYLQAFAIAEKVVRKDHYMLAWMQRDYGHFLFENQRYREAEVAFTQAVSVYRRQFGGGFRKEMSNLVYQTARCIIRGRWTDAKSPAEKERIWAEAERFAREAVEIDRTLPDQSPKSKVAHAYLLATHLINASPQRNAEAEEHIRTSWNVHRKIGGAGSPNALGSASLLIITLVRQRKFDEAETVFREVMKPAGVRHWQTSDGPRLVHAARGFATAGKPEVALQFLTEAVAAGFRNHWQLQESADFQSLRSHPDFQKLLQQIKSKS